MSRRDRGPRERSRQNDRPKGDRPRGDRSSARPHRPATKGDRAPGHRPGGGKPPRFAEPRREKPAPVRAEKEPAPEQLPTKVQTVVVTADENNMRVDRFLEARFPGLSFSHIQRIVRK
ncbi:MAG TPA: hypothetical protein VJR30_12025, partial [Bradyrhizobium sp.]|nr:hypothetical protein [Bradyrhizobium sp.]